ncbi:MAG: hypothetical protein JSV18_07780 [Candidatus Bathyarchaeota archaeon]|nr:MAG: hypothetical protein JSV18_07780 [Candidatus Bathyarchaeota archaeon]
MVEHNDVSKRKTLRESENSLDRKLQAVLAEYNDCRNEIKLRIQQRTQLTQFYIVGIVALIGYALQVANSLVWLIASGYAVFMYTMILGTYFYTDSLAQYIREEIEATKIPYILGEVPKMGSAATQKLLDWETMWLGWEINFERCLKGFNIIRRKRVLRAFTWGVVSISSFCFGYGLLLTETEILPAVLFAFTALLIFGSIIEYVSQKRYPGKR